MELTITNHFEQEPYTEITNSAVYEILAQHLNSQEKKPQSEQQ